MQEIKFFHPEQGAVDYFPPEPAKKLVPEWYKKCPISNDDMPTIKNCPPVQDIITSGYILKSSIEYEVKAGINDKGVEVFQARCPLDHEPTGHKHSQFPFTKDGIKKSYLKIKTGWEIKTPPGYSCLIFQPFYFLEERFTVLPALVDTDYYGGAVQFPIILNEEEVNIKPGTPLVQVIPFKRDEWTSSIEQKFPDTMFDLFISKPFANIYRKFCQQKKKFL